MPEFFKYSDNYEGDKMPETVEKLVDDFSYSVLSHYYSLFGIQVKLAIFILEWQTKSKPIYDIIIQN